MNEEAAEGTAAERPARAKARPRTTRSVKHNFLFFYDNSSSEIIFPLQTMEHTSFSIGN